MNQLSWLLYAADVVGGLGSLSAFLAIVSALARSSRYRAVLVSSRKKPTMGERVVSSPTANKAVQALNHWLDEQINEAAPQGEPEPDK